MARPHRSFGRQLPPRRRRVGTGQGATLVCLCEQEEAGLDLLTDGEQRRTGFIDHVLATWDGVDLQDRRAKGIRRRERLRQVPTITGPVRRHRQATLEDFRYARSHTNRPLKMAVPGPMTVVDTTVDAVYGDEAALAMDVAEALNAEILELQAAGCDVVQIDEPAMTRWHEKVIAYGANALDRCLEGVHIPSIVHLCYGYPSTDPRQHQYEYPELLDILLETRIGGFSVEFARSGYDPSVLARCRDRIVMFGCIDPGDAPPPPVEQVRARVRQALEHIPPDNLWLAPDCGLMTISRDLARAKSRFLAELAQEVRRSL